MKKKIAILFTDPHLAYSPTTINLYSILSNYFIVEIITTEQNTFKKMPDKNVRYVSIEPKSLEYRMYQLNKLRNFFLGKKNIIPEYKEYVSLKRFKEFIQQNNYYFIIAVDLYALWITQKVYKGDIHFLSLELKNECLLNEININAIKSVFIQREDRYKYLFGEKIKHNTFFVQNTPIFKEILIPNQKDRNILLHSGTSQPIFGVYALFNFIRKYPEYKIYFKGFFFNEVRRDLNKLYIDELAENKITIDDGYESEDNIVKFMSDFRIGFCFYDLSYPEANNFNYLTAPSGKMFKYFASGVPVIGNDIPGLSYIKEYQTGVLINNLSALKIKEAIDKVNDNYDFYVDNCLKLAKNMSFDKLVEPYINFLTQ